DQVVLFVVQGRAAEAGDPRGAAQRVPVRVGVLPAPAPGVEDPVGDHIHRRAQVELLPRGPVRRAVQHLLLPLRAGDELPAGRALRAQPPAGDRAVRVALDLDDLLVFDVHALRATDRAVRADRGDLPVGGFRTGRQGGRRRGFGRPAPAQLVWPRQL